MLRFITSNCARALAAVFVSTALIGSAELRPLAQPATRRVVAIGDIHGDLDAFVGILQRTGLIDAQLKWTGANTTLVQLGDMIDRGPKSRAVLDFVMNLQQEAPKAGGRVAVLLGNHEAMNLAGDWRYVTAADYSAFVDGESDHRQRTAFADAQRLRRTPTTETAWRAAHPPGFVERAEALRANGKYGRWIRTLPAVVKINDTLFAHGGISEEMAGWPLDRINQTVADEIKSLDGARRFLVARAAALPFDSLQELATAAASRDAAGSRDVLRFRDYDNWLSVSDTGPLWFRDYAKWTDADDASTVDRILTKFGAARLVAGHTAQPGQIVARFNNRVFVIDSGMFSGYYAGGRASALVIDGGTVTTVYAGGER